MNDHQLHYFRAVYEMKNAHNAAQSIPLSRQGLLKSLNSLEHELGVRLFHSTTASVCVPTRYGHAFYAYATQQERELCSLMQEFKRIDRSEHDLISLGAAIGTMGFLGLGILKEFELMHPNAHITCDEVPDLRCDEGLDNGTYSLALTVYPYQEEFETIELYSANRSIWVSAKDPLANRQIITLENLRGYHVGVVGYTFKNYSDLIKEEKERDVPFAALDTFSEMIHLYRYAMKPGFASFTAPSVAHLFSELFSDNSAPVRSIPFDGLPWKFGITWDRHHQLNDLERAFVEHCVAYAKKIT